MVVKYLFMWKDHPEKPREECEEHYQTVHTTLARKAFAGADGFIKYVQNRVKNYQVDNYNEGDPVEKDPPFDRMVECWFESEQAMLDIWETPEMQACYEDHKNFMNTDIPENLHIYELEEAIGIEWDQQTEQLKLGFTRADEENFGIDDEEVEKQRRLLGN